MGCEAVLDARRHTLYNVHVLKDEETLSVCFNIFYTFLLDVNRAFISKQISFKTVFIIFAFSFYINLQSITGTEFSCNNQNHITYKY